MTESALFADLAQAVLLDAGKRVREPGEPGSESELEPSESARVLHELGRRLEDRLEDRPPSFQLRRDRTVDVGRALVGASAGTSTDGDVPGIELWPV